MDSSAWPRDPDINKIIRVASIAQSRVRSFRTAASVTTSAKASVSIAAQLAVLLPPLMLPDRLAAAQSCIAPGRMRFTTSFGLEDQAITHAIATDELDIDIVTIDTGRLFPETYDLWAQTEERYGIRIPAVMPNRA